MAGPGVPSAAQRHFAVATFVVASDRVLLLFHRKLQMWLPPGGHVEPGELPDEAALREVREETGVVARLIGERALNLAYPRQLIRPEGIQVERVGDHEHVDLVYFAVPVDDALPVVCGDEQECEQAGWYALSDLPSLGVNYEIQAWTRRALATVGERLGGRWLPRP